METFKMITEIYKISAEWCAPCRQLDKELKNFTLLPVKYFDVDDNPDICDIYDVKHLPTLLFMENNAVAYKHVGFITKGQLENKIKELNETH